MKNSPVLVLVALAGLSLSRGAEHARAQDVVPPPAAANLDASTPGQSQPADAQPFLTPPIIAPPAPTPSSTTTPSLTPPNPFKPVPFEPPPALPAPVLPPPLLATPPATQAPARKSTDAQLSARIQAAITQAPVVSSGKPAAGPEGISVTDLLIKHAGGKVTLHGVVHSEKEKSEAGARAAAVIGVGNVVNELIVR